MLELCTYFDRNYLCQALALHDSLRRSTDDARLWMLCFDDYSYQLVRQLDLEGAVPLSRYDLIEAQPELRTAEQGRPRVEFYYACTAPLVEYVFDHAQPPTGVTYVDADMYFFGSPHAAYTGDLRDELMLVEHRTGDPDLELEHGRFNVCLVHFPPTAEGRSCLDWWSEVTLENTGFGNGVWGDQKYLDEFPQRFRRVGRFDSVRAGCAPWNVWSHGVAANGGRVEIDGSTLVAFHFARFLMLTEHLFVPIRRDYLPRPVLRHIYRPYMQAMRSAMQKARLVDNGYRPRYTAHNLRGAVLATVAGRVFYEGPRGFLRLGPYIPSLTELKEWRWRRRLSLA